MFSRTLERSNTLKTKKNDKYREDKFVAEPYEATIEDTYQVLLEEPDKAREILILHDTAGVSNYGPIELKKAYVQAADAFVLVYSSADYESFNRVDLLKKWIDRQFGKDKKEVPIVVLANMRDRPATVDSAFAHSWAAREKVKLFEVTAKDRQSLVDFIHYVGHRHFHPTSQSFSDIFRLDSAPFLRNLECSNRFFCLKKAFLAVIQAKIALKID
ncbi:hypothetical protein CRE_24169 [Caenorhabditis remanei]|uniref:Uncharacterized protein n=1 Tax=Caenorhabditis remanei TaxID=31234 RepID=E3N465_CAERE|nr:hypothetical protein CRE_24169 [Caenorhabditis remanei]